MNQNYFFLNICDVAKPIAGFWHAVALTLEK